MDHMLIIGAIHSRGLELLEKESDIKIQYSLDLPYEKFLKIIEPHHCILSRSETPITKELMEHAPNMKIIALAAVGVRNIDVDYATERGILVIITPGKNTNSVAALTMGLMLSAIQNIVKADHDMRSCNWDRHRFNGIELLNKTLGIIGLGNVGHRVARFALAFDMKVLAFDHFIADEVFEQHHIQKEELST